MVKLIKRKAGNGLVLRIGVLLIIVSLYFITGQQNILNSTFSITSVFDKIDGLQVGGPVSFKGVRVGIIGNINIVSDSTVRVDMVLDREVRKFIKQDALAMIGSEGPLGNRMVKIVSNGRGEETIAEGAEIKTIQPLKFDQVMSDFKATVENTTRIKDMLKVISNSITERKLVRDSLFVNSITQTAVNLNKFLGVFNESAVRWNPATDNMKLVQDKSREINDNLNDIANNVNTSINSYFAMREISFDTVFSAGNKQILPDKGNNFPGLEDNSYPQKHNSYLWIKKFNKKANDTLIYKK